MGQLGGGGRWEGLDSSIERGKMVAAGVFFFIFSFFFSLLTADLGELFFFSFQGFIDVS